MRLFNKFLLLNYGIQFLNGFYSQKNKSGSSSSLTEEDMDYIADSLMSCDLYKHLVMQGKTTEQIKVILGLTNITREKFVELTGKPWPR